MARKCHARSQVDDYRRFMFRTLVMFPSSADQEEVGLLVARTAAAFKERPSFLRMTTSVDALMGPSAERGEFRCLFEADFEHLEDLLEVLNDESFQDVASATEALAPTLLVFECREL
jgi:hypothetical protein